MPIDPDELPPARLTGTQLRVLAHPLRSRLLGTLRVHGPLTGTGLAARLRTNTGAASYHLRQLAAVGLVVEEAGRGRGRERWWRAAHRSHSWTEQDLAQDPDGAEVGGWLLGHGLRRLAELGEEWLAARPHWSLEWRDAVAWSDYGVRLTAQQAQELNEELGAVLERYRQLPATEESRTVLYCLYAFPQGPPS